MCGLHEAMTYALLKAIFDYDSSYLEKVVPIKEEFLKMWNDDDTNASHGCIKLEDAFYFWQSWFDNDWSKKFRTDPVIIELFEKYGHKGTEHRPFYKVADLPDDMEWELWTNDQGMESIHEKHRAWY